MFGVFFNGSATPSHTGEDSEALASKVIGEDVAFPMVYMPVSNGNIVGYFFPHDSDEPVATMLLT